MMWNSTIGRWESIYGSGDGPTEHHCELEEKDEAGGDAGGEAGGDAGGEAGGDAGGEAGGDAGGKAGGDAGGEAGGDAGDDGASKREGKRVDRGLGEHDGERVHVRVANTLNAAMREIQRLDKVQAEKRAEFLSSFATSSTKTSTLRPQGRCYVQIAYQARADQVE